MPEKFPDPLPNEVFEPEIVGFWLVLQQTPRSVTGDPPSLEILPPHIAVVEVMDDASAVVKTGAVVRVTAVI